MGSIYIKNNDNNDFFQLTNNRIYVGGKINPTCYLGDKIIYPDDEFEKWKINQVIIKYYQSNNTPFQSGQGILYANGSSYCEISLELIKGKQKKSNGDWRQVWPKVTRTVYPYFVGGRSDDQSGGHHVVKWNNTDHRLTWDTNGYYKTSAITGGAYTIACYYKDSSLNNPINDGAELNTLGDDYIHTDSPTVNIESNYLRKKYNITDISIANGYNGYDKNHGLAAGGGEIIIEGGDVSWQRFWTTGHPEEGTSYEIDNSCLNTTVSYLNKRLYVPTETSPGTYEYQLYGGNLNLAYYFYINGGSKTFGFPSLDNYELNYDPSRGYGYYVFSLKTNPDEYGTEYETNQLTIFRGPNRREAATSVDIDWRYGYVPHPENSGIVIPNYESSTNNYIHIPENHSNNLYVLALATYNGSYTSGTLIENGTVASDSIELRKDYNIVSAYSSWNGYKIWEIPLGNDTNLHYLSVNVTNYSSATGGSKTGAYKMDSNTYELSFTNGTFNATTGNYEIKIPYNRHDCQLQINSTLNNSYYNNVTVNCSSGYIIDTVHAYQSRTNYVINVSGWGDNNDHMENPKVFTVTQYKQDNYTIANTITVIVIQEQKPYIYTLLTNYSNNYDISASATGGNIEIYINSLKDNDVHPTSTNYSSIENWITTTPDPSNGIEFGRYRIEQYTRQNQYDIFDYKIIIPYTQSTDTENTKGGTITITQKDYNNFSLTNFETGNVFTFTVTQAKASDITLSQEQVDVTTSRSSFGEITVTVDQNVSWTVSVDTNCSSWLGIRNKTTNPGSGSFEWYIPYDNRGGERTGTITVSGGGISKTLTVTQVSCDESKQTVTFTVSFSGQLNLSWDTPPSSNITVTAYVYGVTPDTVNTSRQVSYTVIANTPTPAQSVKFDNPSGWTGISRYENASLSISSDSTYNYVLRTN